MLITCDFLFLVVFVCFCMFYCVLLGSCTCGAGFTGEFCDSKCHQGYFGINCEQVCQCQDGHHLGCDPVTGKCTCKPEWKGIFCVLFLKSLHIK